LLDLAAKRGGPETREGKKELKEWKGVGKGDLSGKFSNMRRKLTYWSVDPLLELYHAQWQLEPNSRDESQGKSKIPSAGEKKVQRRKLGPEKGDHNRSESCCFFSTGFDGTPGSQKERKKKLSAQSQEETKIRKGKSLLKGFSKKAKRAQAVAANIAPTRVTAEKELPSRGRERRESARKDWGKKN